jgi:uncharacterized protein (DUF342 family)
MNGLLLDALYAKYHADKADAVARLNVYLTNSVGIGEHPQHTEEMDALVDQFATAQDKLEALKKMLSHIANSKQPNKDKEILND